MGKKSISPATYKITIKIRDARYYWHVNGTDISLMNFWIMAKMPVSANIISHIT